MRKILLFIAALFLLASVEGQILRYSNYTAPVPPEEEGYTAEFDTVLAAFGTAPHDTIAEIMNALVYSLDTMDFEGGSSAWDRMQLFYVFASHNQADALINWADPGTYNADEAETGITWTQWQGYTGATDDYISTNFNPSADTVKCGLNSTSVGIYIRNNAQDGAASYGNTTCFGIIRTDLDGGSYKLNSTASQSVASVTDSRGLWINTRRLSTGTGAIEVYQNGTSKDTETDTSTGFTDAEISILKLTGSANETVYQISVFFMMNAVTDAEASAINTVIETFMDALYTGVQ